MSNLVLFGQVLDDDDDDDDISATCDYGASVVKNANSNLSFLRECVNIPSQSYCQWVNSAVEVYNGILNSNIDTLRKVLKTKTSYTCALVLECS
eukprot:scaffold116343_cov17-Tisochrysis_lutea.AAC.1